MVAHHGVAERLQAGKHAVGLQHPDGAPDGGGPGAGGAGLCTRHQGVLQDAAHLTRQDSCVQGRRWRLSARHRGQIRSRAVLEHLLAASMEYGPSSAFIMVQKQINMRIYARDSKAPENPTPGTVLAHTFTKKLASSSSHGMWARAPSPATGAAEEAGQTKDEDVTASGR